MPDFGHLRIEIHGAGSTRELEVRLAAAPGLPGLIGKLTWQQMAEMAGYLAAAAGAMDRARGEEGER